MSAATLPHIISLSDCYLIMKCKEQPPLVGVCIHCMDWTGLLDWTDLCKGIASTFEVVRPGSRSGLLWVCQEVGVISFCCRLHVLFYF